MDNSPPPQPPLSQSHQLSQSSRHDPAQHGAHNEHPTYLESVPRQADVLARPHHHIPARPQSAIIRSSKYHDYGHERYPDRHTSRPTSTYRSPSPPRTDSGVHSLAPASPNRVTSGSHRSRPDSIIHQDEKSQHYDDRLSTLVTPDRRSSPSRPASFAPYYGSGYEVSIASSDEDEGPTTRQTIRSLLHLALTAFPLSLAFCLYTILSLLIAALLAPLRLCIKSSPSFSTRLLQLLMPPLNFQRRCIYEPRLIPAPSRSSSSSRTPLSSAESVPNTSHYSSNTSSAALTTTHLLAPLVALPLAICAWVMGTAWGLGAMVSDEEAGDSFDERRIAGKVVSWWAWWLDRGMENEDVEAVKPDRGRRKSEMVQQRGAGSMFA